MACSNESCNRYCHGLFANEENIPNMKNVIKTVSIVVLGECYGMSRKISLYL